MDPLALRHARDRHALERLTSQAAFARALAARHPREAGDGVARADRAEAVMREAISAGRDSAAALAAAEAELAPLAALAKTYTIHCVGHAHIDMNWMWGWNETVATTADTFTTVLRMMDEFPGFIFSQSQVAIYEMVQRYHPQLFERIRAKIREGRWEVVAPHWVEGDRNLASGESLARQLLLSREFCRTELGLSPEEVATDWVPDCFGHAATIPAIDARAGVRHYYCWRTGRSDRPPVFRWRAPDGSEVIVNREIVGYNGFPAGDSWKHALAIEEACGLRAWLLVYGVGDHGGGPTRHHLRRIIEQDAWPVFPRWRFAKVADWMTLLDGVRERLPLIADELNTEYTGCTTSQASIKRNNRRGENACADADTAGALALAAAGTAPRRDLVTAAWRDVCFGQFHDILPGSGVRATRDYSCGQQQRILAATTAAGSEALQAIARRLDLGFVGTPAEPALPELESGNGSAGSGWAPNGAYGGGKIDGWPAAAVWFNPLAIDRDEVVILRVWEGERPWGSGERSFRLRRADGTLVPTQRLGNGGYWGHNFIDVAVPVAVGALGWTALALEEGAPPQPANPARAIRDDEGGRNHPPLVNLPCGRLALENGLLTVEFDKRTGTVKSLRDASGAEFAAGAFAQLTVTNERPYPMSAWITGDTRSVDLPVCERIDVQHNGPLLAAVQAQFRHGDSTMTVTYSLAAGSDRLEVAVDSRWLERGGPERGTPRLSLRFPTAVASAVPRMETPFGSIVRHPEPGRILPCLRWTTLAGTIGGAAGGCTIANDGAGGHSIEGGCLSIDLVRSSYEPDPLPDLGDHRWTFSVKPFRGELAVAAQTDVGRRHNHPLRVVLSPGHAGDLPAVSGAVATSATAGVLLTQVKPAEDGDGLILRLQETTSAARTASVRLAPLLGRIASAASVDLLERGDGGTVRVAGDGVEVAIPALGIASVRVRFVR